MQDLYYNAVDDVDRVSDIAKGLNHLPALSIADQPMAVDLTD